MSKSSECREKAMTLKTEAELKEVIDINYEISDVTESVSIRPKEESNDQTDQSSVVVSLLFSHDYFHNIIFLLIYINNLIYYN